MEPMEHVDRVPDLPMPSRRDHEAVQSPPGGEPQTAKSKRRAEDCSEDWAGGMAKRSRGAVDSLSNAPEESIGAPAASEHEPPVGSLGHMSVLPVELVLHVFSHVPGSLLIKSRSVSRRWRELTMDTLLWKMMCQRELRAPDAQLPPRHRTWEWLYSAHNFPYDFRVHKVPAPGTIHLKTHPSGRYAGDLTAEGRRHGYGYFTEVNFNRYEGDWKDDKEHGRGTKTWKGGSRYEGDWCDGKKHGKARIIWGDGEWKGDVYEGDWVQDHRDGEGKYMWANGDVYKGRWERSKINGRGTKTWANGDCYEGEWKDDERHGCGIYNWPSGNRYEGQWIEGKTNGFGVKYWSNGDRYEGEWVNDNRHGRGVYTWVSGTHYEGDWRDGKKDGSGVCIWSDGAAYDGEWRVNFRHGRGTYVFPDGSFYQGEWHNNLRHGKGIMVWEDGTRFLGDWQDDQRKGAIEEKRWDVFFLKTWEEQRQYMRKLRLENRIPAAAQLPSPSCIVGHT